MQQQGLPVMQQQGLPSPVMQQQGLPPPVMHQQGLPVRVTLQQASDTLRDRLRELELEQATLRAELGMNPMVSSLVDVGNTRFAMC